MNVTTETALRNTDLQTLAGMLKAQHASKHDVVVPLASVRVNNDGTVAVPDIDITAEGLPIDITRPAVMSNIAVGQVAEKADIPVKYVRRMLAEDKPLLATNINRWFGGDSRSVLLRTFGDADGGTGLLRAVMSDSYAPIDNLDAVLATMAGFKAAGVEATVRSADLSENRMVVRFAVPQININIEDLVRHYEFKGTRGVDNSLMELGWVLSNGETGGSAYQLAPSGTVLICKNGMTRVQDAFRKVHLGAKLDAGVIKWSEETISKELDLITSKTKDVIATYSTTDYLEVIANEARAFAAIPVKGAKAESVIKVVAKHLLYSEAETDALLASFIDGRDMTVFGVGQAITATAQDAADGGRQADLEEAVWGAMAVAAGAAR